MTRDAFALPDDFIWGVATAAYQIEGSVEADGRGESIWDRFSHTPGKTNQGETGDVTCDHYNRWAQDIAVMKELGVTGYRFSIAWPRVIPTGIGEVNQPGLDFYDRLVDALLNAGITPFPTLYHWDLPQALEDAGGWPHRDTAYAFADYAGVVADRLGDRVHDWWTINEPWCITELGYGTGEHAPGRTNKHDAIVAAHHVLLAHGLGMEAVRSAAPSSRVGIVINTEAHVARSAHPADLAAAELAHALKPGWYIDPVMRGEYPAAAVEYHGWDQAEVHSSDMATIAAPMDHLGINYYTRHISHDPTVDDSARPPPIVDADLPRTTMGWEVYPAGLRDVLVRLNDEYDLPMTYVAENGVAFVDEVAAGAVHDEHRRQYLEAHFAAAAEARVAGVPLHGYFVWTLMDNFEWQNGYDQRFGLVRIDYESQERIIKDSGHWFATVIAASRR